MLYHYTSLQGLIGMLTGKSIWASHCEFLNDSSEFTQALDFAKSYSSRFFMEDDYLGAFGWSLRDALEKMNRHDVFISSFSEVPDLLSQWRGYCPEGAGVCIGLDTQKINDYCTTNNIKLEKCLYDHSEQKKLISDLISHCLDFFPKATITRSDYEILSPEEQVNHELTYKEYVTDGKGSPQAVLSLNKFIESINGCAPLFKNKGFQEESEWRIIARNPTSNIHYRQARSHVVPYLSLPIMAGENKIIKEIIIGPNPDPYRCAASVGRLIQSTGFLDVGIRLSVIPFNSW